MRARLLPGVRAPEIQPHMKMVGYARPDISLERGGPIVSEMQRVGNLIARLFNDFEQIL